MARPGPHGKSKKPKFVGTGPAPRPKPWAHGPGPHGPMQWPLDGRPRTQGRPWAQGPFILGSYHARVALLFPCVALLFPGGPIYPLCSWVVSEAAVLIASML